jgi:hypothetical protein
MTRPVRLQLSPRKGFNLQEHSRAINGLPAVNVAQPSKWGSPYKVGLTATLAVAWSKGDYWIDVQDLTPLRGKNLACWCGDGPCHADVLLELTNR